MLLKFCKPWMRFMMMLDGGGATNNGGGEPQGNPQPEGEGNNPTPEVKTYDEAYVKKLREEAAANRVKAKELEKQLSTMPQEITAKVLKALGLEPDPNKNYEQQLAEANKKAQEAEAKANERLIRAEVKSVAVELNIVDPEAAYALMDKSAIKVTDTGEVEGVKEALEALAKSKPYLVKTVGGGQVGSGTNPANPGNGQTVTFTRAQIKKMSPEEINANWDAIMKQMAAGGIK